MSWEIHKNSTPHGQKVHKVFHQVAVNLIHPRCAQTFLSTDQLSPQSVSVLSVKGDLDTLYLVTQLDGRAKLQVHTLLDCGQGQQQQGLTVDVLYRKRYTFLFMIY